MSKRTEDNRRIPISILLTKYSDGAASFLYYITGREYTHISISLDGGENYYSFNYKGFCWETIEKHRRRGVEKSASYEISISVKAYEKIKTKLFYFIEHKEQFRYSSLGVVFCLLHIPFNWKNHFFCSQFVADLLAVTEEIRIHRPAVLCLPNHVKRELEQSPYLTKIRYNIV